jgi:hypothetical protein
MADNAAALEGARSGRVSGEENARPFRGVARGPRVAYRLIRGDVLVAVG